MSADIKEELKRLGAFAAACSLAAAYIAGNVVMDRGYGDGGNGGNGA